MATKSFKDICVEYANQLGKGLPLTAPEMCNAVIMYLNTQITEMQSITTALQTAVTEAEASATEAINKANSASGKVDTLQTNVTEAESNATEALNKVNYVSETVNALPKVPTPTASDNGKVIGVHSGAYALVEQSGGEAPSNMVTTNTEQTITGAKTFTGDIICNRLNAYLDKGYTGCGIMVNRQNSLRMVCITDTAIKFYDSPNYISLATDSGLTDNYVLLLPTKNDTLATLDDIPDLSNYSGYIHVINGTAGSGIAVHDTVKASPYTKYGYDKIETYGNSNALQYTLNIPNKNGTIATLDDISSSSGSKLYLHNVTISSTDNGIIYASAITDFDRDFGSFSEIYAHIGKNVSGYYISGGEYYPIVATNIDERERIYVTAVNNGSQETFQFDMAEYTDNVSEI